MSVRPTEKQQLRMLLDGCELDGFEEDEKRLIGSCISWLYYADEVRIGKCCYPQDYVRSRLFELEAEVVQESLDRVHENQTEIRRNTMVYVAKILFSCLMERQSWLALDPYLNRLRKCGRHETSGVM